jgi:Arc/MetJ-type ribon-helix-helix transcriptional regulator
MGRVAKITISLPLAQAAFLDREQARTGTNRSELIARALREAELRLREQRYAAAYEKHPETADELAMSDEAAQDFFGAPASNVKGNGVATKPRRRAAR